MENIRDQTREHGLVLFVVIVFVTALLLLAIFQSNALLSLTYDFPPSVWSEKIIGIAEQWHQWMQAIGAAGVTETIAQWVEIIHEQPVSN